MYRTDEIVEQGIVVLVSQREHMLHDGGTTTLILQVHGNFALWNWDMSRLASCKCACVCSRTGRNEGWSRV